MTLNEEQIDKLLNDLDEAALNFGDDLPGLALNSRGLERSRAIVRAAVLHAAAPEPLELLTKLVAALDGKKAANEAGEPGFEFNDVLWSLLEPARAVTAKALGT